MDHLAELAVDLANLHEALAGRLRRFATELHIAAERDAEIPFPDRVIAAARRMHQSIGPRQLEAMRLIAETHPQGRTTGELMKSMGMDQPNVYLTVNSLVKGNRRLLSKDQTASPHRYHLTETVLREAGA
jgi:hypothetical protein